VGLNLQPGQTLGINALIEHAPLVRAIARQAYEAGARYVDVLYSDQHVRRAHIEQAGDNELGYSPPWLVARLRELGEIGGALVAPAGSRVGGRRERGDVRRQRTLLVPRARARARAGRRAADLPRRSPPRLA